MIMGFALSCRRVYKGRKYFCKYDQDISFTVKKVLGFVFSFASIEHWARWTDYWYSKCKDTNSKKVGTPADDYHFFGEIYDRNQFCVYTSVKFEGRNCLIPNNYDSYLTRRYGDYMTPPPNNKHDRNCYLAYNLGKYREEIEKHA